MWRLIFVNNYFYFAISDICNTDSDCKNGGTCLENGSVQTCLCLGGTEGPFCETISSCNDLKCGDDAICVYDIELKEAKCQCKDEMKFHDMNDKKCKSEYCFWTSL